jgi:hypothetical protein
MACSICGLSGHNKVTCARQRGRRIAQAVAKYGAQQVFARGLDVVCPGLGLTYEAACQVRTCLEVAQGRVTEEDIVEYLLDA